MEANWQLWRQPVPMVPKVATGGNGGKSGNGAKSAQSSAFPSRPSLPWQPLSSRQLVNTLQLHISYMEVTIENKKERLFHPFVVFTFEAVYF